MNVARLFTHFDHLADAPDAIPRLRRFILDLAVRGKLVPQDLNDEPASELLKRIVEEKKRMVETGEIRKPKRLPAIDAQPYPLPDSWSWLPIREVTSDRGHCLPQTAFTYIDVTAIDKEQGFVANPKVLQANEAPSRARKIVRKGDVVYSCVRPYLLNVAIIEDDFDPLPIASTAFAILNGHGCVLPRFQWIVLRSPFMISSVEEAMRGQAYPAINDTDFALLPFPLPPLAEQHRIVAKVDELMALCDRLEAARMEREATRNRMATASLARLNTPDSDPATFQNHAAFALNHLTPLTTRPDQIKALRQTILNLAVRGKLVPQDPNDEPASELLKRIGEWQIKAIAQKQIRAPKKSLKPIKHDESPYLRPNGWVWARLGEVIYIQSGDGLIAANMRDGDVPVFGGNGINGYHDTRNVDQPTIVIGRVGYYCGSIHVTPPKAWVTDNAFITYFCQDAINLRFLVLLLNGTNLKKDEHATAQPVISGSKIYPIIVGLPPLAEQHRIVAKVHELMALCDQLEASLAMGDETRRRLVEAMLYAVLAPNGMPKN